MPIFKKQELVCTMLVLVVLPDPFRGMEGHGHLEKKAFRDRAVDAMTSQHWFLAMLSIMNCKAR